MVNLSEYYREPEISVVVPIFNSARWLRDCLDSVINQTIHFKDIVLVNDGSTDGSEKICKEYVDKYNNINYIYQKNMGQGRARNRGLRSIVGDYVLFLDSDDILRENAVEEIVDILKDNEADIVYFNAEKFFEIDYYIATNYNRAWEKYEIMDGITFFDKSYPDNYFDSACLCAYRRDYILNSYMFPSIRYYEDVFFTFANMCLARQVVYLPQKLYLRRYRENSTMTGKMTYEKLEDAGKNIELITDFVNRNREKFSCCSFNTFMLIENIFSTYIKYSKELNLTDEIKQHRKYYFQMIENLYKYFFKDTEDRNVDSLIKEYFFLTNVNKYGIEIEYKDRISNIRQQLEVKYYKILKSFPFNKKHKMIGIYGIGHHTECLMRIYEKVIGRIESDIFFIITEGEERLYKDKKVYTIEKLDFTPDYIVISSFKYEKEMIREIETKKINTQVIRLYENLKCDIFSTYYDIFVNC